MSLPPQRALVALLFFLSGATSLVYQVLWVRRFTHVTGSGSVAVSIVLAVFMTGLFLGALTASRWLPRCRQPLRWYAGLEATIGLWALLFLLLFPVLASSVSGLAGSLVLAVVLLLPPTAAMGATLPLMVQHLTGPHDEFSDVISWLYAINTFGAASGALLAGFVLLEFAGIDRSLVGAALANLVVAALAWWVASTPAPVHDHFTPPGDRPESSPTLLVVAFLSGLSAIGCEVLWTRSLKFVVQSSTYSYSLILAVFLAGLAIGGAVYRRWLTDVDHRQLCGRLYGGLALWTLLTVVLLYDVAPSTWMQESFLSRVYDGGHHWSWSIATFVAVCTVVLLPATTAMGITFPALATLYHRHVRVGAGRSVSAVFASNTIGSIAGAVLVGLLLTPWVGISTSLMAMAATSLLLASYFLTRRDAVVGLLLFGLLLLVLPRDRYLMGRGELVDDRVLFYDEGRMSTVKVYERSRQRHMSIDGVRIASTARSLRQKEQLLGHLPFLLRSEIDDVLTVGLASGITAHSIALHERVRRLDVVELIGSVFEASRYFTAITGDLRADSRIHLEHADIYPWLRRTDRSYDAIVSDGKLGSLNNANTVLLSADYYELCRSRLASDGIFVQWIPTITPHAELRVILRTAAASFEHAALFYFYPSDVLLVASPEPIRLRASTMAGAFAADPVADQLRALDLPTPAAVMGSYLGPYSLQDAHLPANRLDRPFLEFAYLRHWNESQHIAGGFRARNVDLLMENLSQAETGAWTSSFPDLAPETAEALRLSALQFYGLLQQNFRSGSFEQGLQAWRHWTAAMQDALTD